MGKTRDLFMKIKDTKGTFHAKICTIKDRNIKDLTEAEEIKKRWQEYTELYKKGLNDLTNYDDVVTYLEPDILECEVKWALLRTKLKKMMEVQLSYLRSKKMIGFKTALNMLVNLENSAVATGVEKVSFHFNPKEEQCQRMFRLPYCCAHFTC